MRITAKADYAVRAALELAATPAGEPVKGPKIADAQGIPLQFLEQILLEMKRAGLIETKRGARGGYWLAKDPVSTTIADVIRAVEGPLANIGDKPPEATGYPGHARRLRDVWVAVRVNLRAVLEEITLADLTEGRLPESVEALVEQPGAWLARDTASHEIVG